nr:MAG TPA: hypothetical protein [Caudoviricetes sp.]
MALPSYRCCPGCSANQAARLLPVNPRRVPLSGGILPKGGQPYGFLMG